MTIGETINAAVVGVDVKLCRKCGAEREYGRTLCRACYLYDKRKLAKVRYTQHKATGAVYTAKCTRCGKAIRRGNWCKQCYQFLLKATNLNVVNGYENAASGAVCWKHSVLSEQVLGYKLQKDKVIHHIDEDQTNNALDNLMVLNRSHHVKLHLALRKLKFELYMLYDTEYLAVYRTMVENTTHNFLHANAYDYIILSRVGL